MLIKRTTCSFLISFSFSFSLIGCASLTAELEGFPADTAILIGDVAYQINTVKCAQIRAIGQHGSLDCYDSEGRQSASISPVAEWRRTYVEEKMGMDWASPEHQAYLTYMFHGGGNEKAAKAIASGALQAYGSIQSARNLLKSIDKSNEIQVQAAQMRLQGMQAYASGGMPAWQAHQFKVVQWHLDNSRFFVDQMNKP